MRGALPFLSFVKVNINGLYSDFLLYFYRFTLVCLFVNKVDS